MSCQICGGRTIYSKDKCFSCSTESEAICYRPSCVFYPGKRVLDSNDWVNLQRACRHVFPAEVIRIIALFMTSLKFQCQSCPPHVWHDRQELDSLATVLLCQSCNSYAIRCFHKTRLHKKMHLLGAFFFGKKKYV